MLAREVRDAALALGFVRVGFTPVEPLARGARALEDWLAQGRHGDMRYLREQGPRHDPQALLAGARTLVVVALAYPRQAPAGDRPGRGIVARYAGGRDYHRVIKEKLSSLKEQIISLVGRPVLARATVDTAPLLEREAAARAGVGFIAKSTMLIAPGVGSYILLGELLVDVDIAPDAPSESRCGKCTACLSACPTGAFVDPFVLDARRCISYLTIELKGAIPRSLRPLIGTRVFGCDICQEVCPFNASLRPTATAPELTPRPEVARPLLEVMLLRGSAQHRGFVRGTALRHTSRNQLARNAAVALGNAGDPRAVPALARALATHPSPLVRGPAAWALGRLAGSEAQAALCLAQNDADVGVREEVELALGELATLALHARARGHGAALPRR